MTMRWVAAGTATAGRPRSPPDTRSSSGRAAQGLRFIVTCGATSPAIEGLPQVFDQVLPVLDSHRQADESVVDAQLAAGLRGHRGVRHDRRMLDQALHPAQ